METMTRGGHWTHRKTSNRFSPQGVHAILHGVATSTGVSVTALTWVAARGENCPSTRPLLHFHLDRIS
jgi:hypothetical protein